MSTHWQGADPVTGRWSGNAFRQAGYYLQAEADATVVMWP